MINNYILFFLVIALDRLTKYGVLLFFKMPYVINDFLSINIVMNQGIAWGLMNDPKLHHYITGIIILIYCLVSYHAHMRFRLNDSLTGEVLVLAGGLSNIIDRLYYAGVIDFIVLRWGTWHWPVFNIADAAIVCGVICMFVQNIYYESRAIS